MRNNHGFYIIVLLITILTFTYVKVMALDTAAEKINTKEEYNILVELNECRLYLINKKTNKIVKTYPVAGGKTNTPSPIGTWKIICKSTWSKGFGTRWMQLSVPWGQYGIHGTNKPSSIGGHASSGCIRMLNPDVEELYDMVGHGTIVVIYGGPYNMYAYEFRKLIPGDRGADVFEIQRKLKNKGYYSGALDGIYGEGLKKEVIRFRKENGLRITHDIDREFYNTLEMKPFE